MLTTTTQTKSISPPAFIQANKIEPSRLLSSYSNILEYMSGQKQLPKNALFDYNSSLFHIQLFEKLSNLSKDPKQKQQQQKLRKTVQSRYNSYTQSRLPSMSPRTMTTTSSPKQPGRTTFDITTTWKDLKTPRPFITTSSPKQSGQTTSNFITMRKLFTDTKTSQPTTTPNISTETKKSLPTTTTSTDSFFSKLITSSPMFSVSPKSSTQQQLSFQATPQSKPPPADTVAVKRSQLYNNNPLIKQYTGNQFQLTPKDTTQLSAILQNPNKEIRKQALIKFIKMKMPRVDDPTKIQTITDFVDTDYQFNLINTSGNAQSTITKYMSILSKMKGKEKTLSNQQMTKFRDQLLQNKQNASLVRKQILKAFQQSPSSSPTQTKLAQGAS